MDSAASLLDLYDRHHREMQAGRPDLEQARLLGNFWNKLGRHLKQERRRRDFIQAHARELRELLEDTTHVCAHVMCDARGLTNIAHGAVKAGLLTRELGRDVHALLDVVHDSLHPLVDRQFHTSLAPSAALQVRCLPPYPPEPEQMAR